MPLYHFNFYDPESHRDAEGTILAGLDSACIQAVMLAGELMREKPSTFLCADDWRVELTDHRGLILYVVTMIGQATAALEH